MLNKLPLRVNLPRQLNLSRWTYFSIPLFRLLCIISCLLSRSNYTQKYTEFQIPLHDWLSGKDLGKQTLDAISKIETDISNICIVKYNNDNSFINIPVFETFIFDRKTKLLTLKLHKWFADFYIPPNLVEISTDILTNSRSVKLIHLYTLLESKIKKGTRSISIQNIYYLLGLKPSYRIFSEFNRHFLKKLHNFLALLPKKIHIKYIKNNKKVVSLLFVSEENTENIKTDHAQHRKNNSGIAAILKNIYEKRMISKELYNRLNLNNSVKMTP